MVAPSVLPADSRSSSFMDRVRTGIVLFFLPLLLLGAPQQTTAQQDTAPAGTPPARLTTAGPESWGRWEAPGVPTLSPDGRWLAYTVNRVNDENELRIHPVAQPDSTVVVAYGGSVAFAGNGRWAAWSIGKSEAERERLEKANTPVRSEVGLMDLTTGEVSNLGEFATFSFSPDGGFLALRRHPPQGNGNGNGAGRGTDLIVRSLVEGSETPFGNVMTMEWHDQRPLLAYVVDARDRVGNGVLLFDAASGVIRSLDSDTTRYGGLTWRTDADDLAVLKARTGEAAWADTTHVILAWSGLGGRSPVARTLDPAREDFPRGMRISEHRPLVWARDGSMLHLGIAPREPADTPAAEEGDSASVGNGRSAAAAAAADTPGVEIWHARDVDIIPTQKVRANRDRTASHLTTWHLGPDRVVRLADDTLEDVTLHAEGMAALGRDGTPYDTERMFGPEYQDLYHVDVATGERTLVAERRQWSYGISPGGRYVVYHQDDHYWVHDLRNGTDRNLTQGLGTSFVNLQNDHTIPEKPPFGIGGWTEGDRHLLVYDRYDVWALDPSGGEHRRLTDGAGERMRYRVVRLDFDQPAFDPSEPIYLGLSGEWSKETGYARMRVTDRAPEILVRSNDAVGWLRKAEDTEVYVHRTENFHRPPSFHVGGPRLADARTVGGTNAFHDEYLWGRSELIDFVSEYGDTLQAALFYPAGYEPGRQYPMVVYHYEMRSQAVNQYVVPSDRSPYNTSVFTNTGYFVLQPDIVYRPRNPGLSAKAAIEGATRKVLETGMIDPARVGVMGHSWGGYQTTFLATTSDLFAAAVAGAPLTNLVSMYLSVYWNTGGTDARIFEISQGRMEVPPWEDMASYTANSPVHNIQTMNTPLLMAFGTEDGAVEFNQGVEFYNAARRAEKDMVLLVYEGENHGLARKPNQLDYHRRIREWFDHYLKGEPAPQWIKEGVPWLQQEEERKNPPRRAITSTEQEQEQGLGLGQGQGQGGER
jgi:dipeptidyl aminopeptidase/acylaminoacyl peptidase